MVSLSDKYWLHNLPFIRPDTAESQEASNPDYMLGIAEKVQPKFATWSMIFKLIFLCCEAKKKNRWTITNKVQLLLPYHCSDVVCQQNKLGEITLELLLYYIQYKYAITIVFIFNINMLCTYLKKLSLKDNSEYRFGIVMLGLIWYG